MSSYTMTLKEVIDILAMDESSSTKDAIEKGRQKLFDFDYPIFDSTYKNVFETHFIRTFYMREIGFETEGLFKFNLETWMLVNMPYFNKLFESELLQYDPLTNSKRSNTHSKKIDKLRNDIADSTGSGSQTSNGTTITDNFNREIDSNTPDGRLNLTAKDGEGVIEYASNITENNENNSQTGTSNSSGNSQSNTTLNSDINETEDYVQNSLGKIGVQSFSKLVEDYRGALLRVEKQIFSEMNQLFMLVY